MAIFYFASSIPLPKYVLEPYAWKVTVFLYATSFYIVILVRPKNIRIYETDRKRFENKLWCFGLKKTSNELPSVIYWGQWDCSNFILSKLIFFLRKRMRLFVACLRTGHPNSKEKCLIVKWQFCHLSYGRRYLSRKHKIVINWNFGKKSLFSFCLQICAIKIGCNILLYISNFNYLDKPHFWYKKILFFIPVFWFYVENTVNLVPKWDFFTVRQLVHQIKISWSEPIWLTVLQSANWITNVEWANWLTLLKSANWLTKNKDKTRRNIFYHIIFVQNL